MVHHPKAKLTEEQVENIYWRYQQGGNTYLSLAEEYGVENGTISAILRGRTWKWVTGGIPAVKPPDPSPTHCRKGHEWDAANTIWLLTPSDDKPRRQCRKCSNARKSRSDKRKRGNYR